MAAPTFNLACNVWHSYDLFAGVTPTSPPDIGALACNLQYGRRIENAQVAFPSILMHLLVPMHTDLRGVFQYAAGSNLSDCIEVPAGSGRFYFVQDVDDVSKGFPGEFRLALLSKTANVDGAYQPWAPIPLP